MATSTVLTNKPINPRGDDNRPVDSYNRASLYSGKALDFDGVNDYVDISTFSMSGQDGSFCFYYQQDANSVFRYIFDMIPTTGYRFAIVVTNGAFKILINNEELDAIGEIIDDSTNFFVVTTEGTTQKIYMNGQLVGSQVNSYAMNLGTTGQAAIGSRRDGATAFLNGQLSGFKIFNTVLTAAQVSDLYNNPEKIVPTGVSNDALKLWLPMMEGAGTTAYDGSGNGNHGTISGATWTHGVGSPVAQSAVIDWNKGTNFFSSSDWSVASATTNGTISSSTHLSPNGVDTAAVFDDGTGSTYKRGYKVSNNAMAIGQITASTFVKKKDVDYINVVLGTEGGTYKFYALVNLVNGTIVNTDGGPTATSIKSVGNGWYYVSVEAPHSNISQGLTYVYGQNPANTSSVDINYTGASRETYIWGINIQEGPINNVHLPTIGALQTTPVLLPQGLTTGRDITGVNLFENVRKQGALNLDGNSWAEVHDNSSLDITDEVSVECWAYWDTSDTIASGVFGKWTASNQCYLLYKTNAGNAVRFYINSSATSYGSLTDGWHHIVGTYDRTNKRLYVDGAQVNFNAQVDAIATSSLPLEIGRYDQQPAYGYDDQIAQPRIYNRALTASEVLNNYNATKDLYI